MGRLREFRPINGISKYRVPQRKESVKAKTVFGFEIAENAKVNEDLLEELSIHDPGAKVDVNGNVTVYHRTTAESAKPLNGRKRRFKIRVTEIDFLCVF